MSTFVGLEPPAEKKAKKKPAKHEHPEQKPAEPEQKPEQPEQKPAEPEQKE